MRRRADTLHRTVSKARAPAVRDRAEPTAAARGCWCALWTPATQSLPVTDPASVGSRVSRPELPTPNSMNQVSASEPRGPRNAFGNSAVCSKMVSPAHGSLTPWERGAGDRRYTRPKCLLRRPHDQRRPQLIVHTSGMRASPQHATRRHFVPGRRVSALQDAQCRPHAIHPEWAHRQRRRTRRNSRLAFGALCALPVITCSDPAGGWRMSRLPSRR
jgi:hypothetical protein